MRATTLLLAILGAELHAGLPKFEPADAQKAIISSKAVFVAKPLEVSKKLQLKDGTIVTEAQLRELRFPDGGAKKVIVSASVHYVAKFQITEVLSGEVAVGKEFELKWSDLYGTLCPHLKTWMIRKQGVWMLRSGEYHPYPDSIGSIVRQTLNGS